MKKYLITVIAALTIAIMIVLGGCADNAGGDGTGSGSDNIAESETSDGRF